MSEIIGKKFRRNKYGPSIWEDTVAEVIYKTTIKTRIKKGNNSVEEFIKILRKEKNKPFSLKPMVLGKNTLKAYDFDEIIFYND